MLSPVKAITAGALVFALGGAFLIAQPFEQQGNAPGAETEPPIVAPVEVTGTSAAPAGCGSASRDGSVELDGVGFSLFQCSTERGMPWTFSDPRLEGTVTRLVEEVYIGLDELPEIYSLCLDEPDCDYYSAPEELYVGRTSFSIENEDGAWRERPRNWVMGWSDDEGVVLDGEGAYDGLVAVLRTTGPNKDFRGFIMDARLLPPPAENASAK